MWIGIVVNLYINIYIYIYVYLFFQENNKQYAYLKVKDVSIPVNWGVQLKTRGYLLLVLAFRIKKIKESVFTEFLVMSVYIKKN